MTFQLESGKAGWKHETGNVVRFLSAISVRCYLEAFAWRYRYSLNDISKHAEVVLLQNYTEIIMKHYFKTIHLSNVLTVLYTSKY